MFLKIILNHNNLKLELHDGEKLVAETSWAGELSLVDRLLLEIDALLEKTGISREKVTQAEALVAEGSGVTSTRIVQMVAQSWNLGQAADKVKS